MSAGLSGYRERPAIKFSTGIRNTAIDADALCDRSRRPVRYANQLPEPVEQMIVRLKKEKPHWGARKVRELLVRRLAGDVRIPAKSTVHAVLDRHGLVKRGRQRRRNKAEGTVLRQALAPNQRCSGRKLISALRPRLSSRTAMRRISGSGRWLPILSSRCGTPPAASGGLSSAAMTPGTMSSI